MINSFSIGTRVHPRLEKYVFDRVWNEPYTTYRTNTRPRILNQISRSRVSNSSEEDVVDSYTPAAGVLQGNYFEQIALPPNGSFYVYVIDEDQFRSIKFTTPTWTTLQEVCHKNLLDLRMYSDEGVFLNRGFIYIKRAFEGAPILVAVEATMLHRCLDVGSLLQADVTALYFSKYFDADLVADDTIFTRQLDNEDMQIINGGGTPEWFNQNRNANVVFLNGRVASGQYLTKDKVKRGDYLEYVTDADLIHDVTIDRSSATAPIYSVDGNPRLLFHIPKIKNPNNCLITYTTCDFYIIPKTILPGWFDAGFTIEKAGTIVHFCDREENIHQLTHNDFSLDLDMLDEVALKSGCSDNNYYVHFLVRTHGKEIGLMRDANYIDLLYTKSHDDKKIVQFLLDTEEVQSHGMYFWTAEHLEKNSTFAKAMVGRNGSSLPNTSDKGYYRVTPDKYYKAGKTYYKMTSEGHFEPIETIPGSEIQEGQVVYEQDVYKYDQFSAIEGKRASNQAFEFKKYPVESVNPDNKCELCGHREYCTKRAELVNQYCKDFTSRTIGDYIDIFGYFHTLSLICKRVTTWKVLDDLPVTEDEGTDIPTYIPLALFDLNASEWQPLVFVNGDKVPFDKVSVVEKTTSSISDKLEEQHWTFVPNKNEKLFWQEDRTTLTIHLEGVILKKNDYVTIELIPNVTGYSPVSEASDTFNITERTDDSSQTPKQKAFDPIGDDLDIAWQNTELIYLNGRQMMSGLDYHPKMIGEEDYKLNIQNVTYLQVENNLLEAITTTDNLIGHVKGFLLGNEIKFDRTVPFWFDNLSVLSVDGKVCSNFAYTYDALKLGDVYENGSPYLIRTLVPELVLNYFGNRPKLEEDQRRIVLVHDYFENNVVVENYIALIPKSYRIYSTYLAAIIGKFYKNDEFDWELKTDPVEFEQQFLDYQEDGKYIFREIKEKDVAFNTITQHDLRFVDIYPMYHNPMIGDPKWRRQIAYLVKMLSPEDKIRHKEHVTNG